MPVRVNIACPRGSNTLGFSNSICSNRGYRVGCSVVRHPSTTRMKVCTPKNACETTYGFRRRFSSFQSILVFTRRFPRRPSPWYCRRRSRASHCRQGRFSEGIKGNRGGRYVLTGKEIRSNRERYRVPCVVVSRPHKSGRAPLYLGAPALIC